MLAKEGLQHHSRSLSIIALTCLVVVTSPRKTHYHLYGAVGVRELLYAYQRRLIQYPVSMLIRAFTNYVYAFLLLSGFLIAYNMSREMKRKGYIDWKRRYLARFIRLVILDKPEPLAEEVREYQAKFRLVILDKPEPLAEEVREYQAKFRLTPAIISLVVFYAYIWEHLGNGPIWNKVVKRNADLCKKSMWKNMLYVQNFYPFEEMCATHTHHLSLDMQLSLVAPLLVYLLFVSQGWGILLMLTLHVISGALRYYVSVQNNLSMLIYIGITYTSNVTQTTHTSNAVNDTLELALALAVTHLVYGGWLSAVYLLYLSFFSMSEVVSPEYQYDAVKMSIYYALSPVAFSLALSWVILACVTGHGGWFNSALSWRGLTIFSKISYSMYLTQFLVLFYNVGTTKTSQEVNAVTVYPDSGRSHLTEA
uniref:Uncharacterized protein n=1 Tax=Timema shepardi TaxID=629360 RepID=A0A7R9B4D9_TIMSH|nr:unnamed protein product [Timema shepardi]